MKKIPKAKLERLVALHALDKIPSAMQSDLLADGQIGKKFSIELGHPLNLMPGLTVPQDIVFDTFKAAMSKKKPVPLKSGGRLISKKVFIDDQGAGVIEIEKQHLRFGFVGLLNAKLAERQRILRDYLSRNTLSSASRESLQTNVKKASRSHAEILKDMIVLGTSPQHFHTIISEKLGRRRFNVGDLIPDDIRFWEHLTAPLKDSSSLSQFQAKELRAEHEGHVANHADQAMWAISLTFCAPGLVPLEFFRGLEADTVLRMVQQTSAHCDHFALIGAFEICTDWVTRDSRFVLAGDALLAALFDDKERLENMCKLFGAAFIVSTARHALSYEWRLRPAFWRRITAAAHASLFARAAGASSIDADSIHEWAREQFAPTYVASISREMRHEPRWRAEWIRSSFLVADVGGRARQAIASIDKAARPTSWDDRRIAIEQWLNETQLIVMANFPAIGEFSKAELPEFEKLGKLKELCAEFTAAPTPDTFLNLLNLAMAWGLPPEALPAVHQLLTELRGNHSSIEDKQFQLILATASHASILAGDAALAEKVADLCVERIRGNNDPQAVLEYVFRVIECCTADADEARGKAALVQRMENFAFSVSPLILSELYSILRLLQNLDESFQISLGRAIAATRLGMGGAAA